MVINGIFKHGFIFIIALILAGCGADDRAIATDPDYSNCRYDKPEAIFYDGLPQITDHQFKNIGRGSEEHFLLSGSIDITIVQYGCNDRTQEFKFKLENRNACQSAEECTLQIVRLLQTLSRLGPEYHVFRSWGQAIKGIAPNVQFDTNAQLADGFWIKISHQKNLGNTTLMLTLSEKS